MFLGKPITSESMLIDSCWELKVDVNGYKYPQGKELATQAAQGRKFQILDSEENSNCNRIKVRLLEDGYICWLTCKDIENLAGFINHWEPNLLAQSEIHMRIPAILLWIKKASEISNQYLWGGTCGPNFDCSGLVQAAFASQQIWLPRDSYQQESFCTSFKFDIKSFDGILPGDLVFFGSKETCNHVGIYKGKGFYWHSSGAMHGRNGIGLNQLQTSAKDTVSAYYRSKLRSIGRVVSCHNGTKMP